MTCEVIPLPNTLEAYTATPISVKGGHNEEEMSNTEWQSLLSQAKAGIVTEPQMVP